MYIRNEFQIGFIENSRTSHHILALRTLIYKNAKLCKKNKYLYVYFVDFRQAYDVWHNGLFDKLLKYEINRKVYNIIRHVRSSTDTIEI